MDCEVFAEGGDVFGFVGEAVGEFGLELSDPVGEADAGCDEEAFDFISGESLGPFER